LIPSGTASLLLCCAPDGEAQFSGIRRLLAALGASKRACFQEWTGNRLDLHRRQSLRRVLICGHGSEEEAAFASPEPASRPRLTPTQVRVPAGCRLYLMGCHQGGEAARRAWAAGTGTGLESVLGSEGETESALSTCLLLHLLEDGPESLDRWFPLWIASNTALRPLFPSIRALYREHGGDPLAVLLALRENGLVQEQWKFLEAVERYPQFLSGLA
jgi:hypothetical protein